MESDRTMTDDEPRQVLVHPALVSALDVWLTERGLRMRCVGRLSDDDLDSWIIEAIDEAPV
jgi:hypothetical protein